MQRKLELTAKICEKDEQRRNDLYTALSSYPVGLITVNDLIEVNVTGGEEAMEVFAEIMRICEACECHMFKLSHRG